jgi:hypothetical protein
MEATWDQHRHNELHTKTVQHHHEGKTSAKLDSWLTRRTMDNQLCEGKYIGVGLNAFLDPYTKMK